MNKVIVGAGHVDMEAMNKQPVIVGRNIYDTREMKNPDMEYYYIRK